ncbi:unnamed protein product [Cuscuta europaea]|nr:unnamed protein product [Cuscuta europaea]
MFSGTKYPTANLFFPKICEIRLELEEWSRSPDVVISIMAGSMLGKFKDYWLVVHKLMGVAVVLDPRYKMALLSYYLPMVYPKDHEKEVDNIQQLFYDVIKEYKKKEDVICHESETNSTSTITNRMSGFQTFVKRLKTSSSNCRRELDHYLDDDVLPMTDDFNILLWWKVNGVKYPTLQAIAKDILAIPVSTVVSESAFSASGRLVSPHRNRLHPKTIEALMCAQSWLWNNIKDEGPFVSDGYAAIYEDDIDLYEPGEMAEKV